MCLYHLLWRKTSLRGTPVKISQIFPKSTTLQFKINPRVTAPPKWVSSLPGRATTKYCKVRRSRKTARKWATRRITLSPTASKRSTRRTIAIREALLLPRKQIEPFLNRPKQKTNPQQPAQKLLKKNLGTAITRPVSIRIGWQLSSSSKSATRSNRSRQVCLIMRQTTSPIPPQQYRTLQ